MATPPPVVRVDPAVLRQALGPTLVLREGATIGGRIAELQGRFGILLLRGAPVVAELPEGMKAGQALKLLVAGSENGKVLLRVLPEEAQAAAPQSQAPAPTPASAWVGVPGSARFRVEPDESGRRPGEPDEEGARSVTVRFEGAALGPVELRLRLDAAGGVSTTVRAAPGALAALRAAAGELDGEVRLEAKGGELDLRG